MQTSSNTHPGKSSWLYWIQIALNRNGIKGELHGKILSDLMTLTKHVKWKYADDQMTIEEGSAKLIEGIPWRCFHCDFITMDRAAAEAHFGERDDPEEFKPICRWWGSLTEDERVQTLQDTIQQLNSERNEGTRLLTKIEGLEHMVDSIQSAIRSFKPFRECNTIYDVFCLYDSMEGRALAAEEKLALWIKNKKHT